MDESINSNTVSALKTIVADEAPSQSQFAAMINVERTTLVNDLNQNRKIPDDRFRHYLISIKPENQIRLLRGRLMDLIPQELWGKLIEPADRLNETGELPAFPAKLNPEIRLALEWLAQEILSDPNLEALLLLFCEQLGWEKPKTAY